MTLAEREAEIRGKLATGHYYRAAVLALMMLAFALAARSTEGEKP